MADDLDTCIGVVLKKIEELGIEDNTYIVMTSDNGYRHHFYPGRTRTAARGEVVGLAGRDPRADDRERPRH